MNQRTWTYALLPVSFSLSGCILSLDRQSLMVSDGQDEDHDLSDMIDPAVDAEPDRDGPWDSDPVFDEVEGEAETVCPPTETACGNGLDEDCDGSADCADDDCTGSACNDGDDCTYDDRCGGYVCSGTAVTCPSEPCTSRACNGTSTCTETYNDGSGCDDGDFCTYDDRCGSGSCFGTSIVCTGDACTTRSCNGSSSCTETHAASGTACPDDGNPCTQDVCDGAGSCTHPTLGDGASCGAAYELRCCGGACVNIFTSDANCGGCGITCQGRGCAIMPGTSWAGCHCVYNSHCRVNGADWTCWDPGTGGYCNCQTHTDCAAGQVCEEPSGHNWCRY